MKKYALWTVQGLLAPIALAIAAFSLPAGRAGAQSDAATPAASETPVETGYAPVNGLQMYYEIHGSGGVPLVILHGAFGTVDMFGPLVPALAETRTVITVELQGHGRTADIDRPFTYPQFADDVAALLQYLGVEQADVFGYSMGGYTAQQVAIRHPELVRKLVIASASFNKEGVYPEVWEGIAFPHPRAFRRISAANRVCPARAESRKLAGADREGEAAGAVVYRLARGKRGGDRGANAADCGGCRYPATAAHCGDVSTSRRWGTGRFRRIAEGSACGASRHHTRRRHAAHRMAALNDHAVS